MMPGPVVAISADSLAHIIQLVVAPIVMVTASGVIASVLLGRYAVAGTRLRALHTERFDLIKQMGAERRSGKDVHARFTRERLGQIDAQLPELLRHHRLAHHATQSIFAAMVLFIVCMFLLALLERDDSGLVVTLALAAFLCGITLFFVGIIIGSTEVWSSQRALLLESARIMRLEDLLAEAEETTLDRADAALDAISITVQPEKIAAYEAALAPSAPNLAAIPGYIAHELHRRAPDAGVYLLLVWWQRAESGDADARRSPQYAAWRQSLQQYGDEPPTVEEFDQAATAAPETVAAGSP